MPFYFLEIQSGWPLMRPITDSYFLPNQQILIESRPRQCGHFFGLCSAIDLSFLKVKYLQLTACRCSLRYRLGGRDASTHQVQTNYAAIRVLRKLRPKTYKDPVGTVHTFTLISTSRATMATFFCSQGGRCREVQLYWNML